MKRQKTTLKSYFETGDIPTQSQYENLIDSLRHLDDKLPISDIENLQESLDGKASTETLSNHSNDATVHVSETEKNTWNSKLDSGGYVGTAQDLKTLIDNVEILDKDTPPVFLDSDDPDTEKDILRFTFKGGHQVDVSIKDLVDLEAFRSVSSNTHHNLDFSNLKGDTINVDMSSWFNSKLDKDIFPGVQIFIDAANVSQNNAPWGYDDVTHLFDNDPVSSFADTTGAEVIISNISPTTINQYALRRDSQSLAVHSNGVNTYVWDAERVPSDWTFEGSLDGTTWEVLDTVAAFDFTLDTEHIFSFENSTAYTHYRFIPTGTKMANDEHFLLSEMKLWKKGTVLNNLDSKLQLTDAPTRDENKFYNEKGIATLIPQLTFNEVFIDNVNGNDANGKLEDKSAPFQTYAAAKTALDAVLTSNKEAWTFNFVGSERTYNVNKIPECVATFNAEGYGTTIDFSSATEVLYTYQTPKIVLNNPSGTIKYHKAFTGASYTGHVSFPVSITINAKIVDVDSVDLQVLFGANGRVDFQMEELIIRGGYAFDVQPTTDITINEVTFVAGGNNAAKSIFKNYYGGTTTINSATGIASENCGFFYRAFGGIFTVGNLTNMEIEVFPFGGAAASNTTIVWRNSTITNCYLVPHCNNFGWTGYIKEIVLQANATHRKTFCGSAGSEGLFLDHLTIKLIRWDDNDPTRNTNLIGDLYSGPAITVNNLIVEKSYVTFALIFSTEQVNWDTGNHEPMQWSGMIVINMANDNRPLMIRNIQADPTRYAKVNLFGELYTKQGQPLLKDDPANGRLHQIEIIKQISN
jgi:hypothetical protein